MRRPFAWTANRHETMARVLTKPEVMTVYRRVAPRYDLWATLTESRARRLVVEVAAVRDGEAILEVAVGSGLLFTELLKRNPRGHTTGIDLTEAMLKQARLKAERAGPSNWELRIGDAYAINYPDASFDAVINCYMFDLIPEDDFGRVLAEFSRVLRPSGRLVIATLAPTRRLIYRLWESLYRVDPSWVGGCRGVEMTVAVQRAGFHIERCEAVTQLTMVTEVLRAIKS